MHEKSVRSRVHVLKDSAAMTFVTNRLYNEYRLQNHNRI